MPALCKAAMSGLLVVDVQPNFLKPIHERDRVLSRVCFLSEVANALSVPCLASEQVPDRMGGSHANIAALVPDRFAKRRFSCAEEPAFLSWLGAKSPTQVVIVGIETPICVLQTALELRAEGFEVVVAEDAIGARSETMHRNGLERMRGEGVVVAHSESIAYEWMESSAHPQFRTVLELVKRYGEGNPL